MPMTASTALVPGPSGLTGISPILGGQGKMNLAQMPQLAVESESLFLTQLLQQLRQSMVASVRGRRQEMKEYQTIVDQQVARALSASGGLGLAKKIYEDLALRLTAKGQEEKHGPSERSLQPETPSSSANAPVPGTPGLSGQGEAGSDRGR